MKRNGPKTSEPIRVLIVDDHPMLREGLAGRISRQEDMQVCGEAAGTGEALRLLKETEPDVAVIDIALQDGNGLDLMQRMKDRRPSLAMLAFSMYDESLYAERALRAGALGYLNKQRAREEIVEAVRRIQGGQYYLSQDMHNRFLHMMMQTGTDRQISPIESLTNRELEVFRLCGEGLMVGEIADRLHIGVKTVETYRHRIKTKLNLQSSAELAREAVHWVLENG